MAEEGVLRRGGGAMLSQGRLGHGGNESMTTPRVLEDLPPAKRVCCGEHFCAAVTTDGALYTWGKNKVKPSTPNPLPQTLNP